MSFDYEKMGIALVGIAIFFLVATRVAPWLLGSAASMLTSSGGAAAPGAGQERRPAPRPARRSDTGFAREAVDAVDGDWAEIEAVNDLLARLDARRQARVAREGDLLRSQVAWKVAAFAQAALHRVVALAAGSTQLWNLRNAAGAVECSRAVVEGASALLDVAAALGRLGEAGDVAGIDALVTRLGFADPLGGGGPARSKTDPAKLIDACDREAPGTRARYDILANLADPEALGQVRMAGDVDRSGTAVTFPDAAMFERGVLSQVAGGLQALAVVETALSRIDALLPLVAGLEKG